VKLKKKNLPCCLLAFACGSKNYLQKAKKGEGVPYEETQVGSSNGQTRAATTRGP